MNRPMSETMTKLVARLDRLVTLRHETLATMEAATKEKLRRKEEEETLASALAELKAKRRIEISVEGRLTREKDIEAQLLLETIQKEREVSVAKGLRQAAEDAREDAYRKSKAIGEEIEAIHGAFHAYNRELKVEDSLSNTPASRHNEGGRR